MKDNSSWEHIVVVITAIVINIIVRLVSQLLMEAILI